MSVRSKVAELLALRDSVSESAVSIEKFADEEAVRGKPAQHFTVDLPCLATFTRRRLSPTHTFLCAPSLSPFHLPSLPSLPHTGLPVQRDHFSSRTFCQGIPMNTTPRQRARRSRYHEKFGTRPDMSPTPMPRSMRVGERLTAGSTEHVLRPAASSSSIGLRPSASLPVFRGCLNTARSSTTTVNSFLAAPTAGNVNAGASTHSNNYKKPSPTPSLKRDKVQKLIKEHGSPPGLRVTAGGRIVPHDMPGLGSPQYPVNNGSKVGEWNLANGVSMQRATSQPPYLRRTSDAVPPPAFEPMSRSNSSNTAVNTTISAYGPGFNPSFIPFFYPGAPLAYAQAPPPQRAFNVPPPPPSTISSTARADIAELRKMLDKLHVDQRDLEREMVIREGSLTTEERQNMVEQKVRMINDSDRIRKDIKCIESGDSAGSGSFEQQKPPGLVAPQSGPQPALNPYLFANAPNGFMPFAPGAQFPVPYMLPNMVPFTGFTSLDGAASTPGGEGAASSNDNVVKPTKEEKDKPAPAPANHAARRSHALEIKDPNKSDEQKITGKRSALDPTSPAYTPQKKTKSEASQEDSSLVFLPPSPSPIASPQRDATFAAHFPWLCSDNKDERKNGSAVKGSPERSVRSSVHRPSASSINTADFFPNNPQEHSSTNYNTRKNLGTRQVTPDRSQFAWANVFQSPEESQDHLRAPQVSPVDAVDAALLRNDSALGVHQSEDSSMQNGQLRVPQPTMRQYSDERGSSAGGRPWSRAEASRVPGPTPSLVGQLDFRNKPVSFIMGFSAGLSGQAIQGTEDVDYMQGWAQGLLSAKQSSSRQPSEGSVCSVPEEPAQPRQKNNNGQRQNSFLRPESVRSRLEEGMPRPMGYMPLASTPMHKGSTSTLKATPSVQETRPVAARFETSETTKSISSSMGIGPATVPTAYRTVSAETDKTITEKIDAMVNKHQVPMTHHSGNERDDMKPMDRSNQSPSKLARVFPGQSMSAQSQQKLNRGFNLNCLGDQREQARHSRTSYDGAMDELGGMEDPSRTETMNVRVSPSKGSAFTESPPMSTGSPRKMSKAAAKSKLEEVVGNVGGVGKGKKGGRKNKKAEADEADDPTKMSREEKKNWKEMWKKRFEGIRNEDEAEIEKYRLQNPLP